MRTGPSWGSDGLIGRVLLQPDASRAVRVTVAFMAPLTFCFLAGYSSAAPFVATASQVIATPSLRGDYGIRVVILAVMILVTGLSGLLGAIVGTDVAGSILVMGAIALLVGCWRHLSSEYGPSLGIFSALFFLIALEIRSGGPGPTQVARWIVSGGLFGAFLQAGSWVFRPQHALRKTVADSWIIASEVFSALKINSQISGISSFPAKERELRAILDKGAQALSVVPPKRSKELLTHLEAIHQLAGRFAMRMIALMTSLETFVTQPDRSADLVMIDSVLNSAANTARSVAITIITHRPQNLAITEARLRRCDHLLVILEKQLFNVSHKQIDVSQALSLLQQVKSTLPAMRSALKDTVDYSESRWMFPIRFPELSGLSIKRAASGLNPSLEMDPLLARYSLRMAILTMLAVGVYKVFAIPRGYWIAFTMIVVLQPDFGSTRQKAAQRILGTVGGVLLGTALLWVKMPLWLLELVSGAMVFGFAFFLVRRYALAVLFVTVMLVLITEMRTPVHLDFTVGRLASNVAGSLTALLAAFFFWPTWEREKFPHLMANALRANHDYLNAVAERIAAGKPFTTEAVEAKRRAEREASIAEASFQRLLSEPKNRRRRLERAIALAGYNQRITRAVTVLAAHLRREAQPNTALANPVEDISHALEKLARAVETNELETIALQEIQEPLHHAQARVAELSAVSLQKTDNSRLVLTQLEKICTEIQAMLLAIETSTAATATI